MLCRRTPGVRLSAYELYSRVLLRMLLKHYDDCMYVLFKVILLLLLSFVPMIIYFTPFQNCLPTSNETSPLLPENIIAFP